MDGEAHYLTINKCLNENFPILCANFWPKFGRLYRSVIYGSIKLYGRGPCTSSTHLFLPGHTRDQYDQMVRLWLFGHLQQWKFAPWHKTFAKVGSKFCQILNKPSTFCQSFAQVAKFRQILSHCSWPFLYFSCMKSPSLSPVLPQSHWSRIFVVALDNFSISSGFPENI